MYSYFTANGFRCCDNDTEWTIDAAFG